MKKLSLFLGMALAASLSLTNCAEKIEGPIAPATPAGIPFEISADISTKTTNDGLATKWATGDAINLFHAEAGKTDYVSDNDFKLDATRVGVFKGSLTGTLDASKSYDWYAFYPYSEYNKTPAGVSKETFGYTHIGDKSQTQERNDSKAHLCGTALPLYGVAKGVASDVKPKIAMNNLASVVAVKVKNTTTEPLVVKSVSFTSTEDIVGTYYIDFTGENVVYKGSGKDYVSATASLTVNNGEAIAPNSEAKFYIPIKPHSVKTNSILKISVNGYEKPLTLPKDVTFTAGKIKTLAFNYDKVVVDYVTIPWTENFSRDLSLYTLSNSTKRDESYAKGSAPELMVKGSGSFSAKVKADAGNYVLMFKSNHADYLTVLSSDKNVTVTKESDTEYLLTVPEGGSTFTLTIKNTRTGEKDNARIDDISLEADTAVKVPVITVDKTTVSAKPEGDIVTLKYSIKYPAADATITATSKETWVNTFDYKTDGEVTFAVDANDGEARTATVTLSYPGATPVAVTVSQSAKGAVGGSTWNRVSSVEELLSEGTFIIGYEAVANSGVIVPMRNTATATTTKEGYIYSGIEKDNKGTIDMSTITDTANYEVTIIASSSVTGAICIKIGDKFIGNANTKNDCKLFEKEANTTSFTPTIGENDVVTLKITANKTYHTLQYNTSSPRFAVYGGTQKNVVIYKKN
ncbi:MAG: hypothetical protein MR722_06460 [Bacteroidales bacterium]|nr:hypothetical protein [Bacteroidales bacterium]